MTTIRRIYAYLLVFAALAMVALAVANLGQLVVDVLFQSPPTSDPQYVRDTVSRDAAAALVGLPVWLLHFLWTERSARSDLRERASTLRRLYFYAALGGSMAFIGASLNQALFNAVLWHPDEIVRALPVLAVALVVWVGHWQILVRDRALAGELDGSATLRRWYIYGPAFIGWLALLSGTSELMSSLWQFAVGSATGSAQTELASPIGLTLTGAGVWLFHWLLCPRGLPERSQQDDRRSTLSSVYLFLSLSVGVVGFLSGVSQLLFYALGRVLGVDRPGGIGGNLLQAAAEPTSVAIVYGAGWAYQRYAIRRQTQAVAEARRQAGIRRLYTYTVALIALLAFASGVSGLLWTLGELILGVPGALIGDTWRSDVSQFATLVLVSLPVWALHWRPRVASDDEVRSLARRLYIYLSLIGAMLSLLVASAFALYRVIGLLLGSGSSVDVLSDLAHAAAVAIVAAVTAAYHWRVLRLELQRSRPPAPPVEAPVEVVLQIRAADVAALDRALDLLRSSGLDVSVSSPLLP